VRERLGKAPAFPRPPKADLAAKFARMQMPPPAALIPNPIGGTPGQLRGWPAETRERIFRAVQLKRGQNARPRIWRHGFARAYGNALCQCGKMGETAGWSLRMRNMEHSGIKSMAESDFSRARGKAILSEVQYFMNADKNKLLSFNDVKDVLRPKNQVYLGVQTVRVDLIVGSEGRYRDFNRYFLPKADHLRSRWVRVDTAHLQDIILPSVLLYEIGGAYFVRDGNHRVSVAKAQGVEFIDAEVIGLSSEVSLAPGMTIDELRVALIACEKNIFYESTNFGELTGDNSLDFSAPGRYDVIYNHILVHKYFLNESQEKEMPFSDALVSWYENVYSPTIEAIRKQWVRLHFPGRTESDLYVWIIKHWDFFKKKYRGYSLSAAAGDFSRKYGHGGGKFFRLAAMLLERIFGKAP